MPESYTHHQQHREIHDRDLRAGDRDRDAVAEVLREQHLAGRMDTDEFQERLDRCYAAKTFAELDELVADLPSEQPTRPLRGARRWPAPAIGGGWRWTVLALVPLLIAAIALSHGRLLWLAIPLFLFVGRPLLWRSAGRRVGWGFVGCGIGEARPSGRQV
jgi:Domain of unknown function (DUF1707)